MRIAADTQQRVRDAVRELGYRPNRSAQSLRTASTKTIGLISDFVASGHYASQMLTGAAAAARTSDHLLVIGETEGDHDRESDLIDEMIDRRVDGFVYATLATAEVVVPEALSWRRTVLLNCIDPASPLPAVLPYEFEGGGPPPTRCASRGSRASTSSARSRARTRWPGASVGRASTPASTRPV